MRIPFGPYNNRGEWEVKGASKRCLHTRGPTRVRSSFPPLDSIGPHVNVGAMG